MSAPLEGAEGAEKVNPEANDQNRLARFRDRNVIDVILASIPGVRSFFDLKERQFNLEARHLYNGLPLPEEMLDPKTGFPKAQYASNKIRTTKYTPINFIPKNILFQFKNIANVYFLFCAILSAFKLFGVASAGLGAVPIIAIVVITAIRDAIEDSRRQFLDSELNNNITFRLLNVKNENVVLQNVTPWRAFKKACSRFYRRVWRLMVPKRTKPDAATAAMRASIDTRASDYSHIRDGLEPTMSARHTEKSPRFKRDHWKNVQVGDFLKIYADDPVPADVVVLSTSEEDSSCYIETRNLDGETNLKPRQAVQMTSHLRHAADCANEQFWMDIEGANSNLNSFGWTIQNIKGGKEAMNNTNLIPRGSTVRNTRWVIGYVVYTGLESKIQLNAGETPTKRSRLTRELNFYMYISFLFLFVLSFVGGLVQGLKFRSKQNSLQFFEFGYSARNVAFNAFVNFFATLIMLQNLVPISLYISIEIVRTVQAFFIYSDNQIYDDETNYPCTPKTWSISDDLGQIEFIFSDKTGTLTQNSMVFRKATVNGKSYGVAFTEVSVGAAIAQGKDVETERAKAQVEIDAEEEKMREVMENYYQNPFIGPGDVQFLSAEIYSDLSGSSGNQQQEAVHLFALGLALCNTVVTELVDGKVTHKAESPDESSLVSTARDLGYTLTATEKTFKSVNIRGEEVKYEHLSTVLFTSARKRMSVLLRGNDGRTFVLSKGADNVMLPRLVQNTSEAQELISSTTKQLNEFANEGLRTLVYGYKEVEPKWAEDWVTRYVAAGASSDREIQLEKIADELECDLHLTGGSAIEDQLQVGVPQTIKMLGQAGIRVWMLTGDKMETAISIGFTCNLLDINMKLLEVTTGPSQISEFLQELNLQGTEEEVRIAAKDHTPPRQDLALVIDGPTIAEIAEDPVLSRHFALVGKYCKSVVCCRLSPYQKAIVVDIMKRTFDVTTLAIGDGANDVSMIQRADIGVGLVGVEGRQAAMSSDYAIGKFRFLQRLVLVHGHWSYMRIAELTANLLYKNVVFTMALFWYGIHNQFDNSYLFDYTYLTLFNSVFTSLPVVFMGILDQDVPDTVALAVPQLYAKGILRRAWTKSKFFIYITDGLYQSAISYFFAYLCFYTGGFVTTQGSQVNYRPGYGVFVATVSIISCNLFVLINLHRWDWLTVLIIGLSCLSVFAWTGIYTCFTASSEFYKAAKEVYGTVPFWAECLMGVVVCLIPRVMYMAINSTYNPSDIDIIREQIYTGELSTSNPDGSIEFSSSEHAEGTTDVKLPDSPSNGNTYNGHVHGASTISSISANHAA